MSPLSADLEAFREYLTVGRSASPHTIRNYLSDLEQFQAYLGKRSLTLQQANHVAIRGYLGTLAVDKAASSRARKLASIRTFYRYLVRTKQLAANPALAVKTPKQ